MEVRSQLQATGRCTPGEGTPGAYRIGGWAGPKAGRDPLENSKIPCPCRRSETRVLFFSSPQRCRQMTEASRRKILGPLMNSKLATMGKEEAIFSCEIFFGHLPVGTEEKHEPPQ